MRVTPAVWAQRLHAPTRAHTRLHDISSAQTRGIQKKKLWLHSASNLLLFYGFGQLEYSIAYIL